MTIVRKARDHVGSMVTVLKGWQEPYMVFPQVPQNFAPLGTMFPHFGHVIVEYSSMNVTALRIRDIFH